MKDHIRHRGLRHLLSITFILIAICILSEQGVLANNHADTTYTYYFANTTTAYTIARDKLDSSSAYMYCTNAAVTYVAWVYGYKSSIAAYANYSHGYTYLMGQNTVAYLRNWVYEESDPIQNGVKRAKIRGQKECTGGTVSGKWSPDSV